LSFKPDIVHVHGLRPLWAAARMGLPVVFTNHTSGFLQRLSKSKSKLRRTLARINLSDYLLAPSDELVEAARTVGYQKPCQFISNGVDDQKFHPEGPSMREQWQIPEGRVVVLMARRLVEKNGVMYFAEAAKFLKDQPLQLVIAGQGDERDKVEKILAQHGMLEHTTFLGGVANHEMPQVYRAADISVLPSLMEATSITALETMACGVPLVTTNVGGLPFLVDHGNTGLLVEPREPEQLAAAIVDLAGDPERRAAMGRAARQRIEAELNWGQIAQQTVEAYQTTIGAYS
ncbi:MAG: glycosyltransferase family 4 protein, partial [Cellvibrionaceae bacterium]|nr:glycosyltransferase family 4 protein [Cellvibrionaceae bacterium]